MSLWAYRGEGNAHIVVSHKQKHIVYRMFKRKKNGISTRKKYKTDYLHLREKVLKYLAFTTNVMLPRIDKKYLHCGSLVEISPRLAQNIKASLANRPEYRKHKELDENCPYVLEMPDYCHVNNQNTLNSSNCPQTHGKHSQPVYTIEIKPKWGFLPVSKFISPTNRIKYSVCRYCMHQYQKVATGKWKYRSGYCPLDLFSGDKARMKHALTMLFATPQNNLRIFKDGKVLWNDLTPELCDNSEEIFLREFCQHSDIDNTQDIKSFRSQFDSFLELLIHCLLYVSPSRTDGEGPTRPETTDNRGDDSKPADPSSQSSSVIENGQDGAHVSDNTQGNKIVQDGTKEAMTCAGSSYRKECGLEEDTASKATGLPKDCVLHQILKVQLLDDIDIEGIEPLYEMIREAMGPGQNDICQFDLSGPYDADWCPAGAAPYLDQTSELQNAVKKIKEFLVSRSAKDCSIMISIQPQPDPNSCRPILSESSSSTSSSQVTPCTGAPDPALCLVNTTNQCGPSDAGKQNPATTATENPHVTTTATATSATAAATATTKGVSSDPDFKDQALSSSSGSDSGNGSIQRSTNSKIDSTFYAMDRNGKRHLASIAIIDLDPKPFDRISSYIKEDREVVKYYMNYLSTQQKENLYFDKKVDL